MKLFKPIFFGVCLLANGYLFSQTFNGQGGMLFPPSGTIGQTSSIASVSGIGVIGGCKNIEKITVNLTHTWDGDIALILIAPNGAFLELSSANGGPQDNYIVTEFRDNAAINIVSGSPPYNGSYKPEGRQNTSILNPYSNANPVETFTFTNTFTGINADGDWTLFLNDWVGADAGILNSWSITFIDNTNLNVNAGPDISICEGSSTTLTANSTPPASLYVWSTAQSGQSILVSPASTITYTVTASLGACTGTDAVTVTVAPAPDAFSASLTACDQGGGTALFNLTTLNSTVNGGTIYNVNWYSNAAATIAIGNPLAYSSGNNTVYATVGTAPCASAPVPIQLTINPMPNLTNVNFVVDPLNSCSPLNVDLTFSLPPGGPFDVTYTVQSGGPITTETATLTNGENVSYFVSETTTFTLVSIQDVISGCIAILPNPIAKVVTIDDPPILLLDDVPPICEGESIDLQDFVTSPLGLTITFHDDTPPSASNELPSSVITPLVTSIYYAQVIGSGAGCITEISIPVFVNPISPLSINDGSVCENSVLDLDDLFGGNVENGTWTGPGVFGNFFDATGLNGVITLTFDPENPCIQSGTSEITINNIPDIELMQAVVCESDQPLDLNTLEDINFPNGIWSGQGVSGNIFVPTGLSGPITLTFSSTYACSENVTTEVTVNFPQTPNMAAISICENETGIVLSNYEDPLYPGGLWEGNGVTGNIFDPTGLSGPIDLLYTPSQSCVNIANVTVDILALTSPQIADQIWCETNNILILGAIEDPQYIGGTWTGPGVVNGTFNPVGLVGNNILTYQSTTYCTNAINVNIHVPQTQTLLLTNASTCELSGVFSLTTLQDPLHSDGYWVGQGVQGTNEFIPTGLSGTINLQFISNESCVLPGSNAITIEQPKTPLLQHDTICASLDLLDLTALEDALVGVGTWSGTGVINDTLHTIGLNGVVALAFNPSDACALEANTYVFIQNIINPQTIDTSLCENSGVFDLSKIQDPLFNSGKWFGPGVNLMGFDPQDLSSSVSLSFVSNDFCTDTSYSVITLHESILTNNLTIACDLNTSTYTVSFIIQGGDASSYSVNGLNVPSNFISQPIVSETPFSFQVRDKFGCNVADVAGTKNCSCATFAGSMDINGGNTKVCVGDPFLAIHNNDEVLDADAFFFVLHDEPGFTLGTIYGISSTPEFSFPVGGVLGKTYYISAVAGNALNGFVDKQDPCLSVTPGVPVIFYEIDASPPLSANICEENCKTLDFIASGVAPFEVHIELRNGSFIKIDTLHSLTSNCSFTLCPDQEGLLPGNYQFSILSVKDANCEKVINSAGISLLVRPKRVKEIKDDLCQGQTIVINGKTYGVNKPSGMEVIASTIDGVCDSIIIVQLNILDSVKSKYEKQYCVGEQVSINGTTFNENTPTGQLIIVGGSKNGCDSIIDVNLSFLDAVTNTLSATLCFGESLLVNGKVYDKSRATGQEKIPGGSQGGCDSIINVSLSFNAEARNSYRDTICEGDSLLFLGSYYSAAKTQANIILPNATQIGCDSLVDILIFIRPTSGTDIEQDLCNEDSLIIENQVFNQYYPKGEIILANTNGCDSVIHISLSFFPKDRDTLFFELSKGDSIEVDDITFSEKYSKGVIVLENANENGCNVYKYVEVRFEQKIIDLEIPNVFSPNDDGINDNFEVTGNESKTLIDLSIFDRWGSKVGYISAINNVLTWNGTMNETNLLPGVYVLALNYFDENNVRKTIHRDLTLIQ